MQLHIRGVELVVELLEVAEHLESFSPPEMKRLLKETSDVLAELLKRDVPPGSTEGD